MSGDVTAAIETIRRNLPDARECWAIGRGGFNAESDGSYIDHVLDAVPTVLAEVERLRAEREALHSGETRSQVLHAIVLGAPSLTPADHLALSRSVLSVLTAPPEAGQDVGGRGYGQRSAAIEEATHG